MPGSRVIVAKKTCKRPNPSGTLYLSRTIRGRSNMSIARMCVSLTVNRVFHSSMPGSRVIVADIRKHV